MVERELGRWDAVTSFLARDARDDRRVTLKLFRPWTVNPALLAAEFGILRSLDHPNLLRVLEVGHAPAPDGGADVVYHVSPFVEGETLRQRIDRERQVPLDEALRITGGLASGLTYAHHHSILHQGVKPETVLLTAGETLLTDFGLARWLLQPGPRGEVSFPVSWLAYMSPEQATGSPRIDAQADQYSLACVLYEMLSGNAPFTGPTPQMILTRVTSDPAPRLTAIRVVPRIVERTIERALAKAPGDRFASVDAFAAALHGASARTPSVASAQVIATPRRRWRVPVIASVVVLATGAGVVMTSRAVANLRPSGVAAHQQLTFTGMATAPNLSPDGRSVMYISGGRSLVTHPLDGGEPVELISSARSILAARWSGDGRSIVVSMVRDSMERPATFLVPATGGPARRVLDDARPFDAGPDASVVVRAPRERGRIEIVSLASGKAVRTIVLPNSVLAVGEVSWSPDRRWIALTDSSSRELRVVAASGSTPARVVTEDARRIRWAAGSDALYFLRGQGGAVDLLRVPIDPASGLPAGPATRVTSLLAAEGFDVGRNNRLVHTQTTAGAPALAFVLGGAVPRRAVEQHPVREGTARVDAPAVSPDGRWLAYGAAQGTDRAIHVMAFGGGSARVLTTSAGRDHAPAWSPDGTRLTFAREDSVGRRLMVADARTGIAQRLGSLPGPGGERATAAHWSASGRHIAYYADDLRRIEFVNLQRRNESMVRVPEYVGRGHFGVLPSPNGTQLLATTADSSEDHALLWLVFGNGRRWRQIRGPAGETLPVAWHRNGWIYLVRNRGVATDHGAAHVELWRMRGPFGRAELYAALPEGCGMSVSISADATRGACNYVRIESDLYVASSFGSAGR